MTSPRTNKALAIAVSILVVVAALVWWGLTAMGFARSPFTRVPSATEDRVRDARSWGLQTLAGFAAETADAAWPSASSTPGEAGKGDHCVKGTHNWKIDDPFELRCDAAVLVVGASRPVAAWREDAMDLHARLTAAGWEAAPEGVDWLVRDYWDTRSGHQGPGGLDNNRDGAYGPADLPEARYVHPGTRVRLYVHHVEPGIRHVLTVGEASRPHHQAVLDRANELAPANYAPLLEFSTTTFEE